MPLSDYPKGCAPGAQTVVSGGRSKLHEETEQIRRRACEETKQALSYKITEFEGTNEKDRPKIQNKNKSGRRRGPASNVLRSHSRRRLIYYLPTHSVKLHVHFLKFRDILFTKDTLRHI